MPNIGNISIRLIIFLEVLIMICTIYYSKENIKYVINIIKSKHSYDVTEKKFKKKKKNVYERIHQTILSN